MRSRFHTRFHSERKRFDFFDPFAVHATWTLTTPAHVCRRGQGMSWHIREHLLLLLEIHSRRWNNLWWCVSHSFCCFHCFTLHRSLVVTSPRTHTCWSPARCKGLMTWAWDLEKESRKPNGRGKGERVRKTQFTRFERTQCSGDRILSRNSMFAVC